MLRSSSSAKAFVERALVLIEQGHREDSGVGTHRRGEAFAPKALLDSIGEDRAAFETFRHLFRMYLLQESTWRAKGAEDTEDVGDTEDEAPGEDSASGEEDEE